jgi:hypothetical protein
LINYYEYDIIDSKGEKMGTKHLHKDIGNIKWCLIDSIFGGMKVKKYIIILMVLLNSNLPAENGNEIGKQLILGWGIEREDSDLQTNMAIDSLLKYLEAAKYQMWSFEKEIPSCQIELYRNRLYFEDMFDEEEINQGFYVYINNRSKSDYYDRYIEINLYLLENRIPVWYKLVIYYNNYNWFNRSDEKEYLEFVLRGEDAYELFINKIEELRRSFIWG